MRKLHTCGRALVTAGMVVVGTRAFLGSVSAVLLRVGVSRSRREIAA